MKKVIVVGGGAAGMIAAIASAQIGNQVTIIEKNEKLGKKIFITGKGRCNVTNACEIEDLFKNIISNIVSAIIETNALAVEYHAKSVLYQCASILITHCQIKAALVNPMIGNSAAAQTLMVLC